MSVATPVVGVVTTYFGLFDEGMPAGFRAERLAAGRRVQALLQDVAECHLAGVVDSSEAAEGAASDLGGHPCDAVVVVPTMATPPEWAVRVVQSLLPVPVVVLAVRERVDVPDDYDTTQATRHSLLVGVAMLTNALSRAGVPYELVLSDHTDRTLPARLRAVLDGCAAATAVRRTRLLSFGDPVPGYTDVEVTDQELAGLGVERSPVAVAQVESWAAEVSDDDLDAAVAQACGLGAADAVAPLVLRRAAHVACVVRRAVEATGSTAGTVNCHGPLVRRHPAMGVTACLALALLARDGVMLSCTGDLPVALALVMGKRVAGAALYGELYAVDQPGDWVLFANGGEGDTAAGQASTVRLLPEEHYSGLHGAGVAVAFSVPRGAATLLSFTPLPSAAGGWRLVLAEVDVLDSRHDAMEGPNAMLRWRGLEAAAGYGAWCEAGASHHAVLVPGEHHAALSLAARLLGVEHVSVAPGPR
jgi:L-arabinose isomerase